MSDKKRYSLLAILMIVAVGEFGATIALYAAGMPFMATMTLLRALALSLVISVVAVDYSPEVATRKVYVVEQVDNIYSERGDSVIMYVSSTMFDAVDWAIENSHELRTHDIYNITLELIDDPHGSDEPFIGKVFPNGGLMPGRDYPVLEKEYQTAVNRWRLWVGQEEKP